MKICLLVTGSPFSSNSCHIALEIAQAIVNSRDELIHVFLHGDAVQLANRHIESVNDESNIQLAWQTFQNSSNTRISTCVSAGQRRGVTESNLAAGFEIAGLAQMIESQAQSDRWVSVP